MICTIKYVLLGQLAGMSRVLSPNAACSVSHVPAWRLVAGLIFYGMMGPICAIRTLLSDTIEWGGVYYTKSSGRLRGVRRPGSRRSASLERGNPAAVPLLSGDEIEDLARPS